MIDRDPCTGEEAGAARTRWRRPAFDPGRRQPRLRYVVNAVGDLVVATVVVGDRKSVV
jgi:hypothetical protein